MACNLSGKIRNIINLKRSIFKIVGADAIKFLQGVITIDLQNCKNEFNYTFFLNSQGRFLFDAFIYRINKEEYLVDHGDEDSNDLLSHLNFYKLRSKVKIFKETNKNMYVLLNNSENSNIIDDLNQLNNHNVQYGFDSRAKELGIRLIESTNNNSSPFLNENLSKYVIDDSCYKSLRFELGIAEGSKEIFKNTSLPFEYNIDLLNSVSFDKGCYLGQELTTRTHWTGVIRKRILPFYVSEGNTDELVTILDKNIKPDITIPSLDEKNTNVAKIMAFDEKSKHMLALTRINNLVSGNQNFNYFVTNNNIDMKIKCKLKIPNWFKNVI